MVPKCTRKVVDCWVSFPGCQMLTFWGWWSVLSTEEKMLNKKIQADGCSVSDTRHPYSCLPSKVQKLWICDLGTWEKYSNAVFILSRLTCIIMTCWRIIAKQKILILFYSRHSNDDPIYEFHCTMIWKHLLHLTFYSFVLHFSSFLSELSNSITSDMQI